MGQIGQFRSIDALRYPRLARVIVRTDRGLELGEVLANVEPVSGQQCDGEILRHVTVEDDLLLARLDKNRNAAFEACC